MRIVNANAFKGRDDTIELSDVGHGPDAHSIHSSARNFIIAYEHFAVAAAAQSFHQAFGIPRIAECSRLNV
jgi:hypothetical protein